VVVEARDRDRHGQVIEVLVSVRHDADAARRFFRRALRMLEVKPTEVVTDEADHSQPKHRLRPMHGLREFRALGAQSLDKLAGRRIRPTDERRPQPPAAVVLVPDFMPARLAGDAPFST
jgi:hypothetical protein